MWQPLLCLAPPTHHPSDVGRSYLRVFDDATFDLLASYQLGSNEIPNAVASMSFGGSNGSSDAAAGAGPSSSVAEAISGTREDEPPQFFIVGTAVIKPNVRHSGGCLQLCSTPAALLASQWHTRRHHVVHILFDLAFTMCLYCPRV